MSPHGWRTVSLVLGLLFVVQTWRSCNRRCPKPTDCVASEVEAAARSSSSSSSSTSSSASPSASSGTTSGEGKKSPSFFGYKVPAWAMWLAPQPGETMRDYRDRMVPLAQAAIAPHRARVEKSRDNVAQLIGLDDRQKATLDAAVVETQKEIQDRVMNGILSGELMPATFKPMAGVAAARDILDLVDNANKKFLATLTDDQRGKLATHPFDFADYLVFSAKWEQAFDFLD
jgi:hypothetical protein